MRQPLDGDEALPLQAFEYSERRRQQFTALAVVPRAIAASMVTIRNSAVTPLSLDFIATPAAYAARRLPIQSLLQAASWSTALVQKRKLRVVNQKLARRSHRP